MTTFDAGARRSLSGSPFRGSTLLGMGLVLGVPLLVCALQPLPSSLQKKEIFREDADAEVLVSRSAPAGFAFAETPRYIERATGAGDLVTDGDGLRLRGPVPIAGSADSATHTGQHLVVWDEYDGGEVEHGGSFDVMGAVISDGVRAEPFVIAGGPKFQARPSVRQVRSGEFMVAWEEGPDGWGGPYRSIDQRWNNATDSRGPLHSWRAIRLAKVTADGTVTEIHVPMPSFDAQRLEPSRRPGAERVGVFYERPVLWKGAGSTTWLAYRHVHQREASLAIPKLTTHVERGFSIYVRKLVGETPLDLYRIDERQRDGEQLLEFVQGAESLQIAFETGRSDRRSDAQSKGVRLVDLPAARTAAPKQPTSGLEEETPPAVLLATPEDPLPSQSRRVASLGDERFTLLFGDLHRHTDLSLCFPFFDGSIDDAYRYARGPARLDFLAVTDHARDLDQGRGAGRPWQDHIAAADRHHRPGHFVAFRAYERSQADTDHNVIGLAPDADFLRPHRPPLAEFWAEFSPSDVLTIPHATAGVPGARFSGDVWEKRDDRMRPVAEIYQAFRDVVSVEEIRARALGTGQKFGFIASSDHLATSSAYACVWARGEGAEAVDRRPIFDALQERRCYGATARIELRVTATCSEHDGTWWMGSDLPQASTYTVQLEASGPGRIERAEFWSRGGLLETVSADADGASKKPFSATFQWKNGQDAPDYLFARVLQEDGERAWSSPFFVQWDHVAPSDAR